MKTSLRIGVALTAVPAACVLAAGPAAAAGTVSVSNEETIQAHLDASGNVRDARVYEQLAFQGDGTVTIADPVSTKNLRNLDAFGGLKVRGGKLVGSYTVDGERRVRTVSDFDKTLPLSVKVTYKLDGRAVDPGDVVGRSGLLEVHYTVTNLTGRTQPVTYDDGTGKEVTQDETVVIPMVGSLSTVLPSTFTDVRSAEAAVAGDGHGGTKMTYTMTLFGPIGSPSAEFGYTARITDGVVPPANVSALPVSPLDSPSFKGGAASYKSGADTGVDLTAGATQIDTNVLKLRDGAQQLLAGLIQLRDGATRLNAGLAGQAAPGAAKLADGAGQLTSGTGRLASGAADAKAGSGKMAQGSASLSGGAARLAAGVKQVGTGASRLAAGTREAAAGAGQVDDGAGQLADGLGQASSVAPALVDGLAQVRAGLVQVDGGLGQLYGGIGQLPAKAQPLHDGITQLLAGLGSKADATTLIGGVDLISKGLSGKAIPGIDQIKAALDSATGPGAKQKLQCAAVVLADVRDGAAAAGAGGCYPAGRPPMVAPDAASQAVLTSVISGLNDSATQIGSSGDPIDAPTLLGGLNAIRAGLDTHTPTSASDPGGAGYGLMHIECGLSNQTLGGVCDPAKPGLLEGLGALNDGVTKLVDGVVAQVQGAVGTAKDAPTASTLRGGAHGLIGGVDAIGEGAATLIDGLDQLSAGADDLYDGTGQLAGGLGQLSAGADQLSGGASKASAGAGQLADGAGRLSAGAKQLDTGVGRLACGATQVDSGAGRLAGGADQLSAGLGDAASGSGRLAAGLAKAADSAPALPAGASRLSAEGTSKLIDAGRSTASDYGLKYALIAAGAERAKAEGMAYGAPTGATGTTAYSLELAGATGEGGRNVGRGVGALALFGMGAAATVLRRRWV